jgi:hypothetical protein
MLTPRVYARTSSCEVRLHRASRVTMRALDRAESRVVLAASRAAGVAAALKPVETRAQVRAGS